MRAVRALEEAAHEFRSRHDGRPFVLVVDDADRLAKDRPEALAALQVCASHPPCKSTCLHLPSYTTYRGILCISCSKLNL